MALISDTRLYNGEYCRYARGEYEYDETFADSANAVCSADDDDSSNCTSPRAPLDMPLSRKNWIDFEVTDEKSLPKVLFLFITSSLHIAIHYRSPFPIHTPFTSLSLFILPLVMHVYGLKQILNDDNYRLKTV